jgi:hypothetical protein
MGTTLAPAFSPSAPARAVLSLAAAVALVAGLASPVAGQTEEGEWTAPRWTGDLTFLGVNALTGGLTGGLLQRLEGGSFRDGFTRGTLGGAVAYAGRRVSADRYFGAGFLGRQVSAVGVSMVRNASRGTGAVDELVFPVGPVRFYVDRTEGWTVRPKVVLADALAVAVLAARSETRFDGYRSLSAGAPVFLTPGRIPLSRGEEVSGFVLAGTIVMADRPDRPLRHTFPHERVHVLQYDLRALAWSEPLEKGILERSALGARLYQYVDVGAAAEPLVARYHALIGLDRRDTLREQEARFLDRGPRR